MSKNVFTADRFEHLEKVMAGKRHGGDLYKHITTGRKFYIARCRDMSLVFRKGRKSISEALRDDVAEFSMDIDVCKRMERLGVTMYGFHIVTSDDVYLIDIDRLKANRAMKNYSATSSTYRYYINMEHFYYFGGNKDTLK